MTLREITQALLMIPESSAICERRALSGEGPRLSSAAARSALRRGYKRHLRFYSLRMWVATIILVLAALLVFACATSAQTNPPPVSFQRAILNDSNQPLVIVTLAGTSNASSFAIEERLPANIQAIGVTGGGNYIASNNVIRWGPFTNTPSVDVSYRVAGLPGSYLLDGSASVDGAWRFAPPLTPVTIPLADVGAAPTPPPQVARPVFNPPSGAAVPLSLSITDATPGAAIYYTLDGSLPAPGSLLYTGAVSLISAGVVRARAFASGFTPSVASVAYYGPAAAAANAQVSRGVTTNPGPAQTVTLSVSPGTNASCWALEEQLSPGLAASNVTAGGNYIASNGVVRWGPFLATYQQTLAYDLKGLPGAYTARAFWSVDGIGAKEPGATNLAITSISDNRVPQPPLQVATPTFAPASGGNVPLSVSISCSTTGATIYFTLDGSLPNQASTLYTGVVSLASASVVRARAFTNGWIPSISAVAYYGPPATPAGAQVLRTLDTNSPNGATMTLTVIPATNASCFSLEDRLSPGLFAQNITGGGMYLASNNVVRWGPFLGTNRQTLTYRAAGLPGVYSVSAICSVDGISGTPAGGTLVIGGSGTGSVPPPPAREPTPVLSPAFSSNLPVTVSISSSDPQAQIFFTTDGSLPTQSSAPYLTNLVFNVQTSLRARSFRPGFVPSVAALGEYAPVTTTSSLAVVRSILGGVTSSPSITIAATPSLGVKCYSITEIIPPELTPSGLQAGGLWDPTNSAIHWGPYLDNSPRTFTFKLNGPPGSYPLFGQGSFDGYCSPVTGGSVATITVVFIGPPGTNFSGYVPVVVTQPSNQLVLAGTTVHFNVVAESLFPLSYQWFFNQTLSSGATSSELTLPSVMPVSAGYFSVIVTNIYGSATSSLAQLSVVANLITDFARGSNGSVTLSFMGLPHSQTRIWAATNLMPPVFWLPISTNSNAGPTGTWQFTDTNAIGYGSRFYRFSTP